MLSGLKRDRIQNLYNPILGIGSVNMQIDSLNLAISKLILYIKNYENEVM